MDCVTPFAMTAHFHVNDHEQKSLKLKASEAAPAIDWAAVGAAPNSSASDENSPELTDAQTTQLRPLAHVLPGFSNGRTRITIQGLKTSSLKPLMAEKCLSLPVNNTRP